MKKENNLLAHKLNQRGRKTKVLLNLKIELVFFNAIRVHKLQSGQLICVCVYN